MTKFIVIASGKGGVGKTTTAINLGTALSNFGRDVIVLDANITTPHMGLNLGAPVVPVSLNDALEKKNSIKEAVYLHPGGLKVIPSSISLEKMKSTDPKHLKEIIHDLEDAAEVVIIDAAAGLGKHAKSALEASDEVIVVTNPELSAVTDALRTIRVAEDMGSKVAGVVLTKVSGKDYEMSIKSVETVLEKPVIGIIPHDESVKHSHKLKHPVNYTHPDSPASIGYKKLAAKLIGQKYEESLHKKDTMYDYVMRRLGLK